MDSDQTGYLSSGPIITVEVSNYLSTGFMITVEASSYLSNGPMITVDGGLRPVITNYYLSNGGRALAIITVEPGEY